MDKRSAGMEVALPEILVGLIDEAAGGAQYRAQWLQAAVEQALAANATVKAVFLPAVLVHECERIVGQGPRLEGWVRELIEAELHRLRQPR